MRKVKNIENQLFGRLIAIRCVGRKWNHALWLCRCTHDGNMVEVASNSLVAGSIRSCGCLSRELTSARVANHFGKDSPAFKHGHTGLSWGISPTYSSWNNMITRCTNSNHNKFSYYGGAHIPVQVCDGLREFTGFLSVLGERPEGTTLGRRGDIGNYSCGQCEQCERNGWELNCSWQTPKQQKLEAKIKNWNAQLLVA